WVDDGRIGFQEVYRFANSQRRIDNHDCWDVEELFDQVERGLAACSSEFGRVPESIGIDTWGVDFVLLDENDHVLGDAVAYRDRRTEDIPELVDKLIDPGTLYEHTGVQRQPFNTIYQLIALAREHPEQVERAQTFLMIPDYLNWRLTGVKTNEYTNATTTGLVNARLCDWDPKVIEACGIPSKLFRTPLMPGTTLGGLLPEVAEVVGYDAKVVLPATHDTGSAFLAVPTHDESSVFISSGTWSLIGIENAKPLISAAGRLHNLTNEGGYERRYRYLKNIMGLWMIQCVRREINGVDYVKGKTSLVAQSDHEFSFTELIGLARDEHDFKAVVNVDDDRFLTPDSMIEEVRNACRDDGQPIPCTIGQVLQTIYRSLSRSYADAVSDLHALTGRDFSAINIVGGGCQDAYLNELTAQACQMPVHAGPVEATSIGNLVAQMIVADEFSSVSEARDTIASSFDVRLVR
ncbi:MAG: rhamnulokinase, partial [Atopobiaceae bacterium]|nr:rhamnulokinase [Atopobiaceae bacterium]